MRTKDSHWYAALQIAAHLADGDLVQRCIWNARPSSHHETLDTIVWC